MATGLAQLLLFHLERHYQEQCLEFLQSTTIVRNHYPWRRCDRLCFHCGDSVNNELTYTSYMASQARGYSPPKDQVRTSFFDSAQYYDHDLDGRLLLDPVQGMERSQEASMSSETLPNEYTNCCLERKHCNGTLPSTLLLSILDDHPLMAFIIM